MKNNRPTNSFLPVKPLALLALGLWCQPLLQADVVVLQTGGVLTGTVLQEDGDGVLMQLRSGTYRYPQSLVKEVRKEPAAAPHVSNNGQNIPDWAQIVTLLAKNGWAQQLKQVPATMQEFGVWKSVPYVSFSCAFGGYELNIFGDLNQPAAVQIGAMSYLKQSAEARSNCVNFLCSLLANPDDRKLVRALNLDQKDSRKSGDLTVENIMPGEWGSYGGWWIWVYGERALAASRASDAELLLLTQPAVAAPAPVAIAAQPPPGAGGAGQPTPSTPQPPSSTQPGALVTQPTTTTYYENPAWTAEEMARARPGTPGTPGTPGAPGTPAGPGAPGAAGPAPGTPAKVYPRSYNRAGGAYGRR